ncbi:MAG: nicotinate phosphoribosyltransferase [Anaerolineales bacterium]
MKAEERATAEGILFTDQYQLTMAQLYFRMGLHERGVQFDHFFRRYPDYDSHKAGYCVNAGLEWFVKWMREAHFRKQDIRYLRSQTGRSGSPLFADDFLAWLRKHGTFDGISLRAIPEGRVVHPNVPLTVVQGPLAMAQILETSLLNHLNYQTLIATKASRVHDSARGQQLIDFGLRRGHGKGANEGSRAALIGGAHFSSNVGLSHVLGYPPKGTHAHSMVQIFMAMGLGELAAFRAYAEIYPDDCLLLVDTVNTLESGIPNAIRVFEELRRQGHRPVGIRLDSGDLAHLSIQAAKMLDQAGFKDQVIVLSNNLDELVILQILTKISEEAAGYGLEPDDVIRRLAYGVGTRLITSWGEPALGGVYKLVAIREGDAWVPAIKVSDSPDKTPNPGNKKVWRLYDQREKATADLLGLADETPETMPQIELRHPADHTQSLSIDSDELSGIEALLVDVLTKGRLVYDFPDIEHIREQRSSDINRLDVSVRHLLNPSVYHVSLTSRLWNLKQHLIEQVLEAERGSTP